MKFDEVDRALDTRVVLSYIGKQQMVDFTRKFDFAFQSALNFTSRKPELSYFIPEEQNTNREVGILLAQSRAKKEGNGYFVNYHSPFQQCTKHFWISAWGANQL